MNLFELNFKGFNRVRLLCMSAYFVPASLYLIYPSTWISGIFHFSVLHFTAFLSVTSDSFTFCQAASSIRLSFFSSPFPLFHLRSSLSSPTHHHLHLISSSLSSSSPFHHHHHYLHHLYLQIFSSSFISSPFIIFTFTSSSSPYIIVFIFIITISSSSLSASSPSLVHLLFLYFFSFHHHHHLQFIFLIVWHHLYLHHHLFITIIIIIVCFIFIFISSFFLFFHFSSVHFTSLQVTKLCRFISSPLALVFLVSLLFSRLFTSVHFITSYWFRSLQFTSVSLMSLQFRLVQLVLLHFNIDSLRFTSD